MGLVKGCSNCVKNLLTPAWYRTMFNNHVAFVKKNYIETGKPGWLYGWMVVVGVVGYHMPYMTTHIHMNRETRALKAEALKGYSFHGH